MSDFELVDYERLGDLKAPLVMGTRNNGVWTFRGILTEGDVDIKLMTSLFDHMHSNQDLYETQTLFLIKWDLDQEAIIVKLFAMGIQEPGVEIQATPDLPELPVCYGKPDALSELHSYFTGEHPFHENYPQLVATVEPFGKLVSKLLEGVA